MKKLALFLLISGCSGGGGKPEASISTANLFDSGVARDVSELNATPQPPAIAAVCGPDHYLKSGSFSVVLSGKMRTAWLKTSEYWSAYRSFSTDPGSELQISCSPFVAKFLDGNGRPLLVGTFDTPSCTIQIDPGNRRIDAVYIQINSLIGTGGGGNNKTAYLPIHCD